MNFCSVENCNKLRSGRHRLCSMHRQRIKKYNQYDLPIHPPRKSPSTAQRMKKNNPMFIDSCKQKCISLLKERGRKPEKQGGNGRGLTAAQEKLFSFLRFPWEVEYVVKTKLKREDGYPYHYKIDIANPVLFMGIEIDGPSHRSIKQKQKDLKKTIVLKNLGWTILRFSNEQVLGNIDLVFKSINENT